MADQAMLEDCTVTPDNSQQQCGRYFDAPPAPGWANSPRTYQTWIIVGFCCCHSLLRQPQDVTALNIDSLPLPR